MKVSHRESVSSLKKEMEEGTRRGEDFLCLWIGRINIVKMTILLKTIHRFSEILLKTPMTLFTEKKSPKIHMKVKKEKKRLQIVQATPSKKDSAGGVTMPNPRLDCRATVMRSTASA